MTALDGCFNNGKKAMTALDGCFSTSGLGTQWQGRRESGGGPRKSFHAREARKKLLIICVGVSIKTVLVRRAFTRVKRVCLQVITDYSTQVFTH